MGLPIYIRNLPHTEIDCGHVTALVGELEFVATVALYRSFIEREFAKLAEWDRGTRAEGAEIMRLRGDASH